jgi:hypothetical protein
MAIKKSSGSGIPSGLSAGRPANPGFGQLYANGETARLELFTQASGWQNIVQETPGVSSITGSYSESTNSGTITISGTNFVAGAIASVIGTNGVEIQASSTTYNSLVQLTAVFTGLSNASEPYDVKVTNPSNLFGMLPDALYVNASPVWQTASGSLGTFSEQASITLSALSATDETAITYALASGSVLPAGLSLNSSTGVISGTLPDIATDTTYTFTINASDGSNTIPRAFSINSVIQTVVETLVVAGGGGGGSNGNTTGGGGGGAGGYLYNASSVFNKLTPYTLTVGTGGTGRARNSGSHSTPETGNKGGNSSISGSGFSTITATGGGGGVSNQSGGTSSDANGGSGGGGNYVNGAGTGISGQGNSGGQPWSTINGTNEQAFAGGGGGGSSAVGGNGTNTVGGSGGAGTANSITGTSLIYAAGGGAGARGGYTAGTGGSSIGGNGAAGSGNGGNAPVANRGSGGGGGGGDGNNPGYIGGTGSDGVIVIAYPDTRPELVVGSGLTYDQPTRAGYRVYRFTAGTGTVTF